MNKSALAQLMTDISPGLQKCTYHTFQSSPCSQPQNRPHHRLSPGNPFEGTSATIGSPRHERPRAISPKTGSSLPDCLFVNPAKPGPSILSAGRQSNASQADGDAWFFHLVLVQRRKLFMSRFDVVDRALWNYEVMVSALRHRILAH